MRPGQYFELEKESHQKKENTKIYLYCEQCGRKYPLDRVYCPKCNITLDFNNITIQY